MPEELRLKLTAVRRHLRMSLWKGGICALIAGVLLILLVSASLDWLVIGNSLSGRFVLTTSALGLSLWILIRELWRPLSHPLSDRWLAQRLEQKIPELGGQLASTVEFSSEDYNERFGSQSLQHKSVDTAIRKLLTLDLLHFVDRRPVRIRTYLATISLLLASIVVLIFPAHAMTAMQRLALPWQPIEWPREVTLQLQSVSGEPIKENDFDTQLFPRGTTLELHVTNLRGDLPENLVLLIRDARGETRREALPRISGSDQQPTSLGQILLPLKDSFEFRISGGDDTDFPWMPVEVVPPPMLADLKMELIPPAYTAREPEQISAGTSFVQALIGSHLRISGTANIPLKQATFATSDSDSNDFEIPSGTAQFSGMLLIERVGSQFYRLQLTDELGISNDSALRLEVVGIADAVPQVQLVSPKTDQFLTPDALLNISVTANDDVALTYLNLSLTPQDEARKDHDWQRELVKLADDPVKEFATDFTLSLRELGFQEGDVLRLRLIGRDHLSEEEEHLGIDQRLLTLISSTEKHRELAERLQELIDQIERVAGRQQILKETFQESKHDNESLRGLMSDQKGIERKLVEDDRSLQAELQQLADEADLNQLVQPRFRKRLSDLQRDFQRLQTREFPLLNQFLGRLSSQPVTPISEEETNPLPDRQTLSDPEKVEAWLKTQPADHRSELLAQIAQQQQNEIETLLKDMSGSFSEWKKQQSIQDSLAQLIENQREIAEETRRLNSRLLGKSTSQLTDDERNKLQELSADQLRNQSRLREFKEALKQEAETESPQSQVKDLTDSVQASDAGAKMSENQRSLRENHLNEAIDRNQSLLKEFQEWDDQLNDRPVTNAELKMQLLDEQSRNLDQLARKQQRLGDELQKNSSLPQERNDLQSQQDELNRDAGRIRRMLDRLQLPNSADAVEAAEQPMQQLSEQIENNEPTEDLTQQAEQKLAEAQQAIEEERKSLESNHQLELLTELFPRLLKIAAQQKLLNQVASHLNQEVETAGRWNRPLLKDLNEIRDGQQNLLNELEKLRTALGDIEAVELALNHVLETMTQSHQTLAARNIQLSATDTMPRSLRQLEILLDVLKRMVDDRQSNQENDPADQPADEESEQGEQQTVYVELLLLRAVQQQIQEESRELSKREFQDGSSEQTQNEWERLERKQSDVLRLLQEILTRQQELQSPVEEVI